MISSHKVNISALETFSFSLLKPFNFTPEYFKWMSVAKYQKKQDAPPHFSHYIFQGKTQVQSCDRFLPLGKMAVTAKSVQNAYKELAFLSDLALSRTLTDCKKKHRTKKQPTRSFI